MSPVICSLGTIELSVQVLPPSWEMKIGAVSPPMGSGVKAVAAICWAFAGLTAMQGSLSWFSSPLIDFGIMLTTRTGVTAAAAVIALGFVG